MRKAKADNNQREIAAALRDAGASVEHLHMVGRGVPDLLVGIRGKNYLLEVKGQKGETTPAQDKWHGAWRGEAAIVRSPQDALAAIGLTSYREIYEQIAPGAAKCLGEDKNLPPHGCEE